jgi:hypothetical protein
MSKCRLEVPMGRGTTGIRTTRRDNLEGQKVIAKELVQETD